MALSAAFLPFLVLAIAVTVAIFGVILITTMFVQDMNICRARKEAAGES